MQVLRSALASHYATFAKALSVTSPSDIYDAIVNLSRLQGEAFNDQRDLIERATKDWSSIVNLDPNTSLSQKEAYDFVRSVKGFENNYFLLDYLAESQGFHNPNLFEYARPEHLDYLIRESVDRVSDNANVGLAVSSQVRQAFTRRGAGASGLANTSLKFLDAHASGCLNASELLALVDYTHVHTKTFGFINSCVRHHRRLPQAFVGAAAPVENALRSGLSKLEQIPEFLFEGVLYRGIELHPNEIQFLKDKVITGEVVTMPSLISTTSQYPHVYGGDRGKNTVFILEGFKGASVSCFHHESTENQREVILSQDKPYKVAMHSLSPHHKEAEEYIYANSSGWLHFFVVKPMPQPRN